MITFDSSDQDFQADEIVLPRHKPTEGPDEVIRALWREADELWKSCQDKSEFRGFVPADYAQVYEALVGLKGQVSTMLEWGSGLGVVTIMASHLGFEAYGIESKERLVDWSRELAETFSPEARFALGSFIPEEHDWDPEHSDETFFSEVDEEPAYDELEMDLEDFDLVYAYPWPDEISLHEDIMRKCGGEHSLFLCYDAREGMLLSRGGKPPAPLRFEVARDNRMP